MNRLIVAAFRRWKRVNPFGPLPFGFIHDSLRG
jgi:hypothetical protein